MPFTTRFAARCTFASAPFVFSQEAMEVHRVVPLLAPEVVAPGLSPECAASNTLCKNGNLVTKDAKGPARGQMRLFRRFDPHLKFDLKVTPVGIGLGSV